MSHDRAIKRLEDLAASMESSATAWEDTAKQAAAEHDRAIKEIEGRRSIAAEYRAAADALRHQNQIEQDLTE